MNRQKKVDDSDDGAIDSAASVCNDCTDEACERHT